MNRKKIFHVSLLAAAALFGGSLALNAAEETAAAPPPPRTTTDAYVLESVMPSYPLEMLRRGIQGRALLMLHVSERGEVAEVRVVAATHEAFSKAAVKSAREWYFQPGTQDGVSVPQTVVVPVAFEIVDKHSPTVASL